MHSDQHDAEVGTRLPAGRRKLILKPAQAPGYGFHGSLESVAGPGLNSAPCSRRYCSSSRAFRPTGISPKFTTPTGPVGKRPHSRRICMHVS